MFIWVSKESWDPRNACIGAKAGEKLYLSAKRAKDVVKIGLDITLDIEKFELDLATNIKNYNKLYVGSIQEK